MKKQYIFLKKILGVCFLLVLVVAPIAYGIDLTSTNFIVRDPLVGTGGGFGSSASFGSYLSGDMTMIGSGSSVSFEGRYGFLWYPYVDEGIFTAVPNGANADLSWTASVAGLGWNVSGYKTGIKPSGGGYTYTTHGLVLSYTYAGLAPGDYCFELQTLDAFGNTIATSQEECITIAGTLTFSNTDASIGFGTLSSAAVRYAEGTGVGSVGDTTAHTFSISTNAPNGYTLTYIGPKLTSGGNTINTATNIATGGTPGTSQFALSGVLTGTGSMDSGYNHTNWSSVDNVTTQIASASAPVAGDTIDMHYQANITASAPAGTYSTALTYVLTGNF